MNSTSHWQMGVVNKITQETNFVKSFTLCLDHWQAHLPGQHYDIRLTAENGYQAQRSYSIASSPAQVGEIELTVELIDGGEVSAYLHEMVTPGDSLELRGPIGGHFVWTPQMLELPLLLIAGGSGIVPLMAILRHRIAIGATNPTTLLFSIRSESDLIYGKELKQLSERYPASRVTLTYTRKSPVNWRGYRRRVDQQMLLDILHDFVVPPQCFVCGPSGLVESVATTLINLNIPASNIRTERFT